MIMTRKLVLFGCRPRHFECRGSATRQFNSFSDVTCTDWQQPLKSILAYRGQGQAFDAPQESIRWSTVGRWILRVERVNWGEQSQ